MRFRPSAACAALALGALLPSTAPAQSADAFVLPFGMFRLGVEATQISYGGFYDASGARRPLGATLSGELTPERYSGLTPLAGALAGFFEETADAPGASPDPPDPAGISMGLLDLVAAGSRTEARARISVGILPRIEVGASILIGRNERIVQRNELSGGNLGRNPNPEGNAAILAEIGWAPLGDAALLPTADSPLGIELQARVSALTGSRLTLPEDTVGFETLQEMLESEYGFAALASRLERWRAGDLQLEARGLLLSTFGDAPAPVDPAGVGFRVALTAGARLPTGTEPDTIDLFFSAPTERLSAVSGGAVGDLFVGPRLWISASIRQTWSRETEIRRRIAPFENPLQAEAIDPVTVTISPGNLLEVRVAPRFRLTEAISIGGEYALYQVGDTQYGGGIDGADVSVLNLSGGTMQRLGIGIRYSSLPAFWVRRATLPADIALEYQRTLSGPQGAQNGGRVTVTASVVPRLW